MSHGSLAAPGLDWARVETLARTLPPRHNLVVPKTVLSHGPPHRRSWMGRKRGALRQFRCDRHEHNLHIKEYADRWVVHVDRWNPHQKMWRHLLVDHGFKHFVPLDLFEAVNPFQAPQPTPVPALD